MPSANTPGQKNGTDDDGDGEDECSHRYGIQLSTFAHRINPTNPFPTSYASFLTYVHDLRCNEA